MIFSIIILIAVLLVAYFHYLQGFFSAGISAVISMIAAVVALAYYEPVVAMINAGKFNNQAMAMVLVCLFAIVYLLLRLIFDKLIPGNVRFPVLLDKIGAGVCGIIAGLMGGGILAIAAQSLPFDPTVGMYARYDYEYDRTVTMTIKGRSQQQEPAYNALKNPEDFTNPDKQSGMMIPADDLVLALAEHVSAPNGSLNNGKPLESVHPDLLQELFGQRIGLQSGSKKTALQGKTSVEGLFYVTPTMPALPQSDPERFKLNNTDAVGVRGEADKEKKLSPTRKPEPDHVFLVVRAKLHRDDSDDKTDAISFGPANVRLVTPDSTSGNPPKRWKNHFPIGTIELGKALYVSLPDDYLFVPADKAVDLVFEVKAEDVFAGGDDKEPARTVRDGVLFEFKRFARTELGGESAVRGVRKGEIVEVLRKEGIESATPTETVDSGAPPAAEGAPLKVDAGPVVSANLPDRASVNIGNAEPDASDMTVTWGVYSLQGGKLSKLEVAGDTPGKLGFGPGNKVSQFAPPEGKRLVQVTLRPVSQDRWAFAGELPSFTLTDAQGNKHPAIGVWAAAKDKDGKDMVVVQYDASKAQATINPATDLTPTNITLFFAVPTGTQLKSVDYKEGMLKAAQLSVPQ